MAAAQPLTARYGTLHNVSMAAVSLGMIVAAIVHFIDNPANAPTLSMNDQRFVLFAMLAMAMLYYVFLGVSRTLDRRPQVIIDRDGILLGFGRNRRLAWDDIGWVRLRRLALRPQLEIGLADQAFIDANLRLSMWSFDDSLRPVRGQPTTVMVRDNGLDTAASAMLDAVRTFRPNLVKS
ncbi:MAG: PH domain-containing protein [Alphaproteobacteria bacterium]|nr:PH domain-containing protein [Alphaproteobacteria bacterium]